MLTVKEAARIGINACIDKIGRDFVLTHRGNGCNGYGESDGGVYCFVGTTDKPYVSKNPGHIVLDDSDDTKFPYYAKCNVSLEDGSITFLDFSLPS